MAARLFLLCVLTLTLTSCASLGRERVVFVPPEVNCGAYEVPKVNPPGDPPLTAKDPAVWQLWGIGWQAVAEHILGQRIETARCLQSLKAKGIIK